MRGELKAVLDGRTVEYEQVDTATGEISNAEALIADVTSELGNIEADIGVLREKRSDLRARLKEGGVSLKAFDCAREELEMYNDQRLDAYRSQCRLVRRVLRVPEQLELLVEHTP